MTDRRHLAITSFHIGFTGASIIILAAGAALNKQRVGNRMARAEARISALETQVAELQRSRQQTVLDALPDITPPVEVRIPR